MDGWVDGWIDGTPVVPCLQRQRHKARSERDECVLTKLLTVQADVELYSLLFSRHVRVAGKTSLMKRSRLARNRSLHQESVSHLRVEAFRAACGSPGFRGGRCAAASALLRGVGATFRDAPKSDGSDALRAVGPDVEAVALLLLLPEAKGARSYDQKAVFCQNSKPQI